MSDQWMTYVTRIEETPVIVFLDAQFADAAPIADKPALLRLLVGLRDADDNGFPSAPEQAVLDQLEERLMSVVADNLGGVYVGRLTYQGIRQFFAYAATGDTFHDLATLVMEPFSDYKWKAEAEQDADWQLYREQLLPTKYDEQSIKNQQVVMALVEAGDRIEQPRDVRHWAYFPTDEARQQYIERVTAGGMTLVDQNNEGNAPNTFGVCTSMNHAVGGMFIDDLTGGLLDIAEEAGGEYDGWESPVVTG